MKTYFLLTLPILMAIFCISFILGYYFDGLIGFLLAVALGYIGTWLGDLNFKNISIPLKNK